VTDSKSALTFPAHLARERRLRLEELARRNEARHGTDLLGLVLSGSAGRGVAKEWSDLDVYVVLSDSGLGDRSPARSSEVDEIPVTLSDLERVPEFGSDGWWFRRPRP
jgi:predicted nucleotidyltransferase